jgi:hypothetical protein
MLTCVYHPIDKMQVVEDDEAERLVASGCWFKTPALAKVYRNEVEHGIKTEAKKTKTKSKEY